LIDESLVYWWNPARKIWVQVSWEAWTAARAVDGSKPAPVVGLSAGDHYFVVCILDDDGTVVNIIPHRYEMPQPGIIGPGVFDWTEEECEFIDKMYLDMSPSAEDEARFQALRERGRSFRSPRPKPPTSSQRCCL
jgi:hypothetical protein